MTDSTPQIKTVRHSILDDLDGSIIDVVYNLKRVGETYGYDRIVFLDVDGSYGNMSVDAYIYIQVPETPEEIAARLLQDEKDKAWRKRQYLALKKEFDPST